MTTKLVWILFLLLVISMGLNYHYIDKYTTMKWKVQQYLSFIDAEQKQCLDDLKYYKMLTIDRNESKD